MIIKCNYEGCNESIVGLNVLSDATFTCRKHTPVVEKDVDFQSCQFDKELKPGVNSFAPGFQIIYIEQRAQEAVPEWAQSDTKIRELLYRSFPKLETSEKERLRAGRWVRVIYLHFKMDYSISQVANEMALSVTDVRNILNRIRRVASGRRANNTGLLQP